MNQLNTNSLPIGCPSGTGYTGLCFATMYYPTPLLFLNQQPTDTH